MKELLKYFLPIYGVMFFVIAILWRSYLVWKRTGINPYVLGKSDNAHDFMGKMFRVIVGAIGGVVGVFLLWDRGYQYLAPISWLQKPFFCIAGMFLLVISLIWIVIAQSQMGKSWRIGIDTQSERELIRSGLFKRSRNPIFLGMRVTLMGLFFVLPNAVTFAIWVLGDVLTQVQVRLEEAYLSGVYGTDYEVYCKQTPRWL